MVLDFISDQHCRNINRILKNYEELPIRLVTKTSKKLKECFGSTSKNKKHTECEICNKLPGKYTCIDRCLVYRFSCQICHEFYIGQTARPFKFRFSEHKMSLSRGDGISALSTHALQAHYDVTLTIDSFNLDIFQKAKTPLETRLIEAKLIDTLKPNINRRHETR